MTHHYLVNSKISPTDLDQLIILNTTGELLWSDDGLALVGFPVTPGGMSRMAACFTIVGQGLAGIRIGYDASTRSWTYLRMSSPDGQLCYIDDHSARKLRERVDHVFVQAKKAIRLGGNLISTTDELRYCERCQDDTPFRGLYDAPHGLAGAYMAGSQRLTCTICERSIPLPEKQTLAN